MKTNSAITYCAVALLALLSVPGRADVIRPPRAESMATQGLTVFGHAELKVKPDIAYVTLSVTTQSRDQAVASRDNAVRATKLLEALEKGAGIAANDIQTQGYGIEPQYDYKPSPPVLTGYQVVNTFRITIRDLPKAGAILDLASQNGANNISGVSFDLADRAQSVNLALGMAVVNARAKGEALASAAGIHLGRLVSLTEGTAPAVQPLMQMRAAASAPTTTPVAPGELSVSADVTLVYALDESS